MQWCILISCCCTPKPGPLHTTKAIGLARQIPAVENYARDQLKPAVVLRGNFLKPSHLLCPVLRLQKKARKVNRKFQQNLTLGWSLITQASSSPLFSQSAQAPFLRPPGLEQDAAILRRESVSIPALQPSGKSSGLSSQTRLLDRGELKISKRYPTTFVQIPLEVARRIDMQSES